MRELPRLVGRHLRESARRPGARRLLFVAALVLVTLLVGLGRGARGASTVMGAALVFVGFVAFVAAAGAGAFLPRDRQAGRTAWLATLAPAGATQRLSAALAGLLAALALALAGAVVVALAVPRLVEDVGVRQTTPLELGDRPRLAPPEAGAAAWRLPLPPTPPGGTVEVVFAPPYALADAPLLVPRLRWRVGERAGEAVLAHGGSLLVPLAAADAAAAPTAVELENLTPGTWLFVREAYVLGAPASLVTSLLVAGLALGLAAAGIAAVAVLVSRFTSAPTAVLTGLVLALVGGTAPLLLGPRLPTASWTEAWGGAVLHAAARLAPDLSGLVVVGEPGVGHALALGDLGALQGPLLYALVVLGLVALPLPGRRWGEGGSS